MSDEMMEGGEIKKFAYVNRKAPYGTVYALESLEVVLIGAAFEQDVSVVFMDDGVFEIVQATSDGQVFVLRGDGSLFPHRGRITFAAPSFSATTRAPSPAVRGAGAGRR